jgi:hypothetical protein
VEQRDVERRLVVPELRLCAELEVVDRLGRIEPAARIGLPAASEGTPFWLMPPVLKVLA